MNKSEFDEIQANLIKKSLEQNEGEVIVPPERRKGDDGVLKFINLKILLEYYLILSLLLQVQIFLD